jgi:hypothetical protein
MPGAVLTRSMQFERDRGALFTAPHARDAAHVRDTAHVRAGARRAPAPMPLSVNLPSASAVARP